MKKICVLIAVGLLLSLTIPAFAEGEEPVTSAVPEYRLVEVIKDNAAEYTFEYDNGGYLPTVGAYMGSEDIQYTYDDNGRLIHYLNPNYIERSYSYGDNGELLDESDITSGQQGSYGSRTVYSYGGNGELLHKEFTNLFLGNETLFVYDYTYDENGVLLRLESSSKDAESSSASVTEYTYDGGGDLIKEDTTTTNENGETVSSVEYTYDDEGNTLSETKHNADGGVSYTYTYEYDDEGRVTTEAYTSDSSSNVKRYIYTPLLTIQVTERTDFNIIQFYLYDSEGHDTFPTFFQGIISYSAPEFTFDENGYLTRMDYTNESSASFDFIYEAVDS